MVRAAALLAGFACLLPATAAAQSLEPIGDFESPVHVTSDPNPERLLVVEQGGRIVLSEQGAQSEFLDLDAAGLVLAGGERGLLSVALAPDHASSGRLYVFYTRDGPGDQRGDLQIDEFTASGDSAPVASRRPVLTIDHEQEGNHNGGQLQFGPDGYLYIATGDGGGSGDPYENGQDLRSLLGKILRIDPRAAGSQSYSIPADNPFVGVAGKDEIWSYGLRNPWRFSFDRETGDLLIGDVGQSAWEEVNYDPAPRAGRGVNFGWDCREGRHDFEFDAGCPPRTQLTDPILEYPNVSGPAAVTGGYVVRDPSLGELYGRYVYADVYSGPLRSLVPALPDALEDRPEPLTVQNPVSFGEDSCARLYVASATGSVSRIVGDEPAECDVEPPPPPPQPEAEPGPQPEPEPETCAGEPVTMTAAGAARGTGGDDVILGGDGVDRIRGGGGDDLICGRDGNDRLRGGAGADALRGGPGEDRCRGGDGRDRRRSC
jgi:glucose/arabinose dehydrogenase